LPPKSPRFDSPSRALNLRRGQSAAATEVSAWCADAARLLHVARRHGPDHADTCSLAGGLAESLVEAAARWAPFELDVTARALLLGDEPVLLAERSSIGGALEHELPGVLHRDGIRGLRIERGLELAEARALLDAILVAAPASATHEDLATQLWELNPPHMRFRAEEFDVVRVPPTPDAEGASPVHADDWELPAGETSDVTVLWSALAPREAAARDAFARAWESERATPFADAAAGFVDRARALDAGPTMAEALAASLVTWIATCVQRSDWEEATIAYDLLQRVAPDAAATAGPLGYAFGSVDAETIAERIDEADVREQSRLFAFVIRVGAPAAPLLVAALAYSGRARVRAGVTTALAYAFAEEPAALGRWLGDGRWNVVRNIVFVLGQIGGAGVVPQLAIALRHVDTRVRRAAIHALGQVPHALRRPLLISQLDHTDARLVSAALGMLAWERDARVAEALMARIGAPEFEARPEEQKIAFISALGEIGDESVVPALEELLVRGGWFARRSPERTAAARALARMESGRARSVLEQGLHHRSEAVRAACDEALASRSRA